MFIVTDYARSKSGHLRYYVRDINKHSNTYGLKGYITAKSSYVRPVYYDTNYHTLTIINPSGVNEYRNRNLAGKVRHFKQGIVLKIAKVIDRGLTTRYQLSNGHYVTGNRKLVALGTLKSVKRVKTLHNIKLYNSVNLTKSKRSIKKGTILKVKRYEYSNPYSRYITGAKRYVVTGGYITASHKFVKTVK